MSDCCSSWLNRSACCRERPTYIYLYNPRMSGSSSSTLFRCLACLIFAFCLAFILGLTGIVIYHMNSDIFSLKSNNEQRAISVAKRQQLPEFVNLDIDPCEHFYQFVCDKWIQRKRIEGYGLDEDNEQKRTRIRHRIHDILMMNISINPSISSESDDFSVTQSAAHKLYQLCETQSRSLLLDELERYFNRFIQQEPYRSHLTIFNRTNAKSSPVIFSYNPFFQIISSPNSSTIIRIHPRSLPSPIEIFPNLSLLNHTALNHLIKFNKNYTNFLEQANSNIKFYEQEYSEDSLIIKRILSYENYHQCLSSINQNNGGLQNLIDLLDYFLQNRLRQFNTKLMDKEIRKLEKMTDNHTLVEHLRHIRLYFETFEQIIPLDNQTIEKNTTCIINLLDKLIDRRFHIDELPSNINFYQPNSTGEYFISNDWPYIMMLYDQLLNKISLNTLVNFVFFDYYRHFVYPYYQPHIHRVVEYENSSSSCSIQSCFDILNCYHPSILNHIIDVNNQIPVGSVRTIVLNLINRFRLLIEQSDNLFPEEKKLLITQINEMKILIGHYSPSFTSISDLNSSSYLEYVQLFSSLPYDRQVHSYSVEPIYTPSNHTLFIPYGFIYLNRNSIEYPLMNFLLKIFSQTIQSSPLYIECLIKSFDDSNSTLIDFDDEHIIYLLFRSKFLSEQNIILDEYLWPFMSANSLMKQFLINYTADNYCRNANTYQLYMNNTYLMDDIYLVFHCQQASSIKQSKCTVN